MTGPDAWRSRLRSACGRLGLSTGTPVVIGVSGGADSVLLLRGLHELGVHCVAVHVNVGLRGLEANADEHFVRTLCRDLGVPCEVVRETLDPAGNTQDAARRLRIAAFAAVAARRDVKTVAVGHTQSDQAESVLLALMRGASLRGLAGMPESRPLERGGAVRLVRPLLEWSRGEVRAVMQQEGWTWRDDATNADDRYRRGWVRHTVLPLLQTRNNNIEAHLSKMAARLQRTLTGAPPALQLDRLAQPHPLGGAIGLAAALSLPHADRVALWIEALRRWLPEAPRTSGTASEIDRLLDAQVGRRTEWGTRGAVWREREHLAFVADSAPPMKRVHLVPGQPSRTAWGWAMIGAPRRLTTIDPHRSGVETVDAESLSEPLVLRPWRHGDRMHPLGMTGTKYISDLLTDTRVRPSLRSRQVVLEADGTVVWLASHRLAERLRVRPETRRVCDLVWLPATGTASVEPLTERP